jgi:hypothetical protein
MIDSSGKSLYNYLYTSYNGADNMIRRSYLIFLVAAVAFIFTLSPASGAWGARWSSGSAIGSGNVSGLKKAKHDGASLQSVAAHPGALFCGKKTHLLINDCHDADPHQQKQFGTDSSSDITPFTVPDPANTPGVVFCQNLDYPTMIVQGTHLVNLTVNMNGNAFIPPSSISNDGNATFTVHDQVDPTTLNQLFNASSICPTSAPEEEEGMPSTPRWTIIDFVAQTFSSSLQASDSKGHVLTQAVYDCTLPGDITTLAYQEAREYTCTTRFNQ